VVKAGHCTLIVFTVVPGLITVYDQEDMFLCAFVCRPVILVEVLQEIIEMKHLCVNAFIDLVYLSILMFLNRMYYRFVWEDDTFVCWKCSEVTRAWQPGSSARR
jgi:hypothetical protein